MDEIDAAGSNQQQILAIGAPPNSGTYARNQHRVNWTTEIYRVACFDSFVEKTTPFVRGLANTREPDQRKKLISDFLEAAREVNYSFADRVLKPLNTTRKELEEEFRHLS